MAVQSQSYSAGKACQSSSNNDDIELEWLDRFVSPAMILAGFVNPILGMREFQEVEAVGGIGSILSQCQKSHFVATWISCTCLDVRSASTFPNRLRHV